MSAVFTQVEFRNPMPGRAQESTPSPEAHVDALFTTLYAELSRLARRELRRNGVEHAFEAATLVHEAWLDIRRTSSLAFAHPGQFLAYAARMMRGLVIDCLRKRDAQKRGGDIHITSLDTQDAERLAMPESLQDIQGALDDLAAVDPALAQVVDLKFFCGFSMAEIASMQNTSERTVHRQWEKARTLLFMALREG